MSYIEVKNLSKEYVVGNDIVTALNNISFEIEEGSFNVILGASGSGKSTTLNALGGMDKATSGEVFIDGKDITKLTNSQLNDYRRTDVGFVFQFYNLIPSLSVYENVSIVRKLGRKAFSPEEMLKAVGLKNRQGHFPQELSGGELQRVSIARALCKNPKILLCDEPTGALDTKTGRMVLELLKDMSNQYHKTVIIVTHNSLLAPTADRVIRIKDGKVEDIQNNENPLPINEVVW